ncbi:MAG: Stp1/IreP family PP2C-type Ser/Thr phosphatase [Pseudobutyrivibrio sp.]|nr:Stp1/IreP family PP2C-type Ser/Thr phosphatase [Pseudobutyrivibrio sp.]
MKSFALTDVGCKRDLNQDTVYMTDQKCGALPNLYIVADGMGGQNAGDYASVRTVEVVLEEVAQSSNLSQPVSIFEQAIQKANAIIYEEANRDLTKNGMGTTIVMASVIGNHLFVGNVGDSRLYVAGKTKLTQITRDHSVVAELVRNGELDAKDAKSDKRKNMITRAVGAEKTVNVDYFDVTLKGYERVLLCSDGLTNMVDDRDILSVLGSTDTIENKATRLVELANNNGGRDNVSAIVIEPF